MAVENFQTGVFDTETRFYPIDRHGKLRMQAFELAATTVAGDATSTIDLAEMPQGRLRLLPGLSRLQVSAMGSGRTMTLGTRAYYSRDPNAPDASENAEDLDCIATGIDVSSAITGAAIAAVGNALWMDFYSVRGFTVTAQVNGGTIPSGATLSGYLAYLYE